MSTPYFVIVIKGHAVKKILKTLDVASAWDIAYQQACEYAKEHPENYITKKDFRSVAESTDPKIESVWYGYNKLNLVKNQRPDIAIQIAPVNLQFTNVLYDNN